MTRALDHSLALDSLPSLSSLPLQILVKRKNRTSRFRFRRLRSKMHVALSRDYIVTAISRPLDDGARLCALCTYISLKLAIARPRASHIRRLFTLRRGFSGAIAYIRAQVMRGRSGAHTIKSCDTLILLSSVALRAIHIIYMCPLRAAGALDALLLRSHR